MTTWEICDQGYVAPSYLTAETAVHRTGSASTTAAAANLSLHGRLSPPTAAVAAILTSVASALVNLPVLYRQTRRKEETRTLSVLSFVLVLIGLAVLLVRQRVWQHLP